MRRSEERILTTHAGSLPRPPELVRLYVRRAAGEAVDAAEIEAAGRAALALGGAASRSPPGSTSATMASSSARASSSTCSTG